MPNIQIPISEAPTNPPGDDGNDLLNCYFQEVDDSDTYNFYESDGTQIDMYVNGASNPSVVQSGDNFTFTYDELKWTVTQFVISNEGASGNWSAVPVDRAHLSNEGDDPETGTFQGQSGTDGDLSASASASK